MNNLTFEVKNLGVIKEGGFTQKPLTVFSGPNGSGKTWAMYSLYHFYRMLTAKSEDREGWEKADLVYFNKVVGDILTPVFNDSAGLLENATFQIANIDEQKFHNLIRKERTKNILLIPAERNALHLFYRELSSRRSALRDYASRKNIDLNELLRGVRHPRYVTPIAHYINWLNRLPELQRDTPGDFHSFAERVKRTLVQGAYRVAKSTGDITFKPYKRERNGEATQSMGLHMTSSTVKSLFGIWFFLENRARKGDLLMIEEPELQIHPENQLKIARLLARLVNAGLNVVISTHSDYIIREFNSLLMLNEDRSGRLKSEYGYDDEEVLRPDQIGAYLFDDRTIVPFKITPDDGIHASTFDKVIREMNRVNDGIYYDLMEQRMEQIDD